jgi:hypothetical protein
MFSATLHLGVICSGNNADALQCKRYTLLTFIDRKRLNSPCHQELSLLRRLELDVVTRRWISRQRTGRPCHRATPILGTTLGTTSVKDVSRRRCFSPAESTVPPRLFFHLPSFSIARLRRRPFPTTRRRRLIRPVSHHSRRYTLAKHSYSFSLFFLFFG